MNEDWAQNPQENHPAAAPPTTFVPVRACGGGGGGAGSRKHRADKGRMAVANDLWIRGERRASGHPATSL